MRWQRPTFNFDQRESPFPDRAMIAIYVSPACTPSLTLDLRDNFFTPTDGWYADVSLPVFREWLGGDRDYEELALTAARYQPLTRSVFLSIRASGEVARMAHRFAFAPTSGCAALGTSLSR